MIHLPVPTSPHPILYNNIYIYIYILGSFYKSCLCCFCLCWLTCFVLNLYVRTTDLTKLNHVVTVVIVYSLQHIETTKESNIHGNLHPYIGAHGRPFFLRTQAARCPRCSSRVLWSDEGCAARAKRTSGGTPLQPRGFRGAPEAAPFGGRVRGHPPVAVLFVAVLL